MKNGPLVFLERLFHFKFHSGLNFPFGWCVFSFLCVTSVSLRIMFPGLRPCSDLENSLVLSGYPTLALPPHSFSTLHPLRLSPVRLRTSGFVKRKTRFFHTSIIPTKLIFLSYLYKN